MNQNDPPGYSPNGRWKLQNLSAGQPWQPVGIS